MFFGAHDVNQAVCMPDNMARYRSEEIVGETRVVGCHDDHIAVQRLSLVEYCPRYMAGSHENFTVIWQSDALRWDGYPVRLADVIL